MSDVNKETLETIQKMAQEAVGAKANSTAYKALIAIRDYCSEKIDEDATPAKVRWRVILASPLQVATLRKPLHV